MRRRSHSFRLSNWHSTIRDAWVACWTSGFAWLTTAALINANTFAQQPDARDPASTPTAEKRPIPAKDDQKEAERIVKRLFADQYDKATAQGPKGKLAATLLATAIDTRDDPTATYVLLSEAQRLATEGGVLPVAFQAISLLDERFKINNLAERAAVLRALSSTEFSLTTVKAVSTAAMPVIEDALRQDAFDTARGCIDAAIFSANRTANSSLAADLTRLRDDADALRKQHLAYEAALEELQRDPNHKAANLIVGTYIALRRNDWVAAERHIILAGDEEFQQLLATQFSSPERQTERLELADSWWKFGDVQTGIAKVQARAIAGHWYSTIVADLGGLTQRRVQDRMANIPLRAAERTTMLVNRKEPSPSARGNDTTRSARGNVTAKTIVYLSDLPERNVQVWHYLDVKEYGWSNKGRLWRWEGPSSNKHNGRYEKIIFAGKETPNGLLTHPTPNGLASVKYDVGDLKKKIFRTKVGVADNRPSDAGSPLTFEVYGDGKQLWASRPEKKRGVVQECTAEIVGVKSLELRVRCPGDAGFAFAVWSEPRLSDE